MVYDYSEIRRLVETVTGINFDVLAPVDTPRSRIWHIYGMKCVTCENTWDSCRLARHHFIPLKIGKALGLTTRQLNNSINYRVVCEDCIVNMTKN